jgi:hypothetical protein
MWLPPWLHLRLCRAKPEERDEKSVICTRTVLRYDSCP